MKKETVKQFFQFLEKKEGKESIAAKLIISPKSLPEGLEVGGTLWLDNTSIQSLSKGLKVRGSLWLSNTPIQSLPEGLKVGGNLFLRNTPLSERYSKEEIRKMVKNGGGYVKGDIVV